MNLQTLELTNYWLPLIWVFGAGLILGMFPKETVLTDGRTRSRWYWLTAVILVIPLILWAGARQHVGDTTAYMKHFIQAPSALSELPAYLARNTKDQGFSVLMILFKSLGVSEYKTFFMIIAAIQMLGMVKTFRKYSANYWICIFLFVASTDYISWMFNGMRQFLAATIIFAASGLLFRKRMKSFFVVVLLASLIHGSALLMLPIATVMIGKPFNKKTLLAILATILVMPVVDRLMPMLTDVLADTQYSDITTNEIWRVDDGTNIIRVLVYSVPALVALFGWRYIQNSTDTVMNICVNGALITMALYLISSVTSGIYVGRLPIYTTFYGYMALPWILDRVFEKQTRNLILVIMVVCYLFFYIYQMGTTWGML